MSRDSSENHTNVSLSTPAGTWPDLLGRGKRLLFVLALSKSYSSNCYILLAHAASTNVLWLGSGYALEQDQGISGLKLSTNSMTLTLSSIP